MNSSEPTRRDFLIKAGLLSGATLLGLPGCGPKPTATGGSGDKPFAGQILRVFVYSGSWEKGFRDFFVPKFEAETGAKVVVDPGWWDSIPKLKASPAGQPAFDLVLTDATQGYPAIKEGLFQTIDLASIPNKANLVPSALDNWVVKDGYGVTFPDSVMTLAYNKTSVTTPPPAKWGDLLADQYSGQIGLYDSFYMSLYTFACMLVDQAGRPGTAAAEITNNLQGVLDFAKANRDRVKLWWPTSTDMALNLTQRNCALGNMHGTDMIPALASDPNLGATVPAADRAFVLLMWVIPTGTKVKSLAEHAINTILSDEVQLGFARAGGTAAIPSVAAKIAAENPTWAAINPSTPAGLADISYYPYGPYLAHWDEISTIWDREILRKSA